MLIKSQTRAMFLAVLAASATGLAPIISWLSSPLAPNETALVAGGFFSDCTVSLTAVGANRTVSLVPVSGHSTNSSLKFIVPADFPKQDVFRAVIINGDGAASAPRDANAPSLWWVQGDAGDGATPGGWIRVFGETVSDVSTNVTAARQRLRFLRHEIASTGRGAMDDPAGDDSMLAATAAELLALRATLASLPRAAASLRLTPVDGGSSVVVAAAPANATVHAAYFALPADLSLGVYAVAVSNGLGDGAFVPLDSFLSPAEPHRGTITVISPAAWPPAVFHVDATTLPVPMPAATSDASVAAALAAATAAGGGTVLFAPGQFYLSAPIVVPPRTRIVGAGASRTGIYFVEASNSTAPAAYFSRAPGSPAAVSAAVPPLRESVVTATSWGIADLSVFITGFHNFVIDADNTTDGFWLERVRVRANAWFGQNGPFAPTRGRAINESNWENLGTLLQLNAANFFITDNDLFGSYNVISSQRGGACHASGTWPEGNWVSNNCHGAAFGLIARNEIYHGGAGHVMNQWQHVIFEANVLRGVSLMAMGQAMGTCDGGVVQHVYIADNDYRFVWGNDREVMTFNCAGGSYFGPATAEGAVLTTAGDTWPAASMDWGGFGGGAVVVVAGAGVGQTRRIVTPGVNATPAPSNRTWVLDAPFDVPLAAAAGGGDGDSGGSVVAVLPFRGQNIFFRNAYADVGSVQFYGHAVDNVVSEALFTRTGGLLAAGQWRDWDAPGTPGARHSGCGLGNGIQPNVRDRWSDNTFLEGLTLINYNCEDAGGTRGSSCGERWFDGASFVLRRPYFFANATTPVPQHLLTVARRSAGLAHSAFLVGASTSNAIVEDSAFAAPSAAACVLVDSEGTDLVWVRGTACGAAAASSGLVAVAKVDLRGPR